MEDFNSAETQREFDLIPRDSIVPLHATLRPGGTGEGGWLKLSKDAESQALDFELTVVDGPYAKRKLWLLLTVGGERPGHQEAAAISKSMLRAMIESARGIRPDDMSEAATAARRGVSYGDFDALRFWGKVGTTPARGDFRAKNTLSLVITPDHPAWKPIPQLERHAPQAGAASAPALALPAGSKPAWAN